MSRLLVVIVRAMNLINRPFKDRRVNIAQALNLRGVQATLNQSLFRRGNFRDVHPIKLFIEQSFSLFKRTPFVQ